MAKKFTEVLDDEILESKKPAGCVGGIFQLFDCQQLLGGKQLSEQGNRRVPSAHAPISPSISLSCNLEKNQSRRSQDNPRYSMESSRTSFSSTFTSFSSHEHKSPQEEPLYTQRSFLSGRSPRNSPRTSSAFKEIIKESIYRDLCGATMKEDDNKGNKVMKSIHSPRPMEQSKVNDFDESLRIVFKLKVSPERFYEGGSPRFSYDGAEISQAFINMNKYSKHSGLARMSLDSKEGSLTCNLSPRFNSTMKQFDRNVNKRIPATLNQLQDLESNEKSSNIVAKLMGLEPLNSATQNSIRCNDFFSEQKKNQMLDHERKHEKPLQSPRNIARSPRRNNPHLDFKFPIEETPRMAQGYVEENMNRKIQSVFNTAEKRPEKLRCHHSNMELRYLKRVLLETKENGNRKLSPVNSLRTKLTPPSKKSIPERAFKSPIVILEPARKLDVSYSKVTKLEDLPGLGEIRTSDSRSNRKKDLFNTQTNADQSFADKKAKCRGPHPSSKEQNERAVNGAVSPRLQHMKPDLKMKAFAAIPSYYDSNKSPMRPVKSKLLDSVSPRCKLKNKSNKIQDIELQNSGEQVNVEAIRANNCIEVKSLLLQQSIQSSSVKVGNGVALVSEAKKHAVQLKDLSATEHSIVSPRCSCPNSAPNALLNQDGLLHSPVSVSKVFKEYQNLPSDCNFTKECPPLTIRTTVSSRTDSEIPESKNTIIQGSRDLRTTVNEAHVTNAALEDQDQDSTIVAEIFLVCGLLQKESDLLSMLEQITSDKPYEFVQKSNPEKLHQKLILDVVNEILAQKLDVSSSSNWFNHMLRSRSFSIKHLYKELCSEIKCLQSCNEGNWDDNSMIHKDVLRHPQAWDSFEREIPALVLEIERLIFKDLINDVVNGENADALYAKQRRQRQMLTKDGI